LCLDVGCFDDRPPPLCFGLVERGERNWGLLLTRHKHQTHFGQID
jgi:hypothetical protein